MLNVKRTFRSNILLRKLMEYNIYPKKNEPYNKCCVRTCSSVIDIIHKVNIIRLLQRVYPSKQYLYKYNLCNFNFSFCLIYNFCPLKGRWWTENCNGYVNVDGESVIHVNVNWFSYSHIIFGGWISGRSYINVQLLQKYYSSIHKIRPATDLD